MNELKEKNDLGYPVIEAEKISIIKDLILVSWEYCQDKFKAGKFTLDRPDTHKKIHYTGEILAIGPDVSPYIKVGDRIIFDQFSNFEKLWDDKYGRVALLSEGVQSALFAIVPPRTSFEITEGELEYDYSK